MTKYCKGTLSEEVSRDERVLFLMYDDNDWANQEVLHPGSSFMVLLDVTLLDSMSCSGFADVGQLDHLLQP